MEDNPVNLVDTHGTCTPGFTISSPWYGTVYTINSCAAQLIEFGAPVAGLFGGPPGVVIGTVAAADVGISSTLSCNGSVNIIVPITGAPVVALPAC